MSLKPEVAIVGAGLAGLTLARLLTLHGFNPTVFESEISRTSRPQGGSLDLHHESGQLALREAGLIDQFQQYARNEGEDMKVADKTGKLFIDERDSSEGGRPEVDRIQLRDILLDSTTSDSIRWGAKVTGVSKMDDNGKRTLHLEQGSQTEPFDLVVGADGAWSRVRPALSTTMPHYSGISCVEFRLKDVDRQHTKLSELIGRGSYFALSDNKALMGQRNGDKSIRIYAMIRSAQDWLQEKKLTIDDHEQCRSVTLDEFHDWSEDLKEMIRSADNDFIPRLLFMLPVDFNWDTQPGVTLIGDAAHLMTPFAGEGANLAMVDALELAKRIKNVDTATGVQGLQAAVKDSEATIMARAQASAKETFENLEIMFNDDQAPKGFYNKMLSYQQQ
ncbi:MAG: hypothetical protein M1825_004301 [Sarcosagium campestre]|nr:MAG: hypothetical protein M1825_004301 [Sarcosagium campestre]